MELFYTTKIELSYFYLQDEEAIHCIKSLRKRVGDVLHATDGLGNVYHGSITHIDTKKNFVIVQIAHQERQHKTKHLALCIAPTKNIDRMEWLVEKAVELGVSQIQWIHTQHSQRKNIPIERMQRIAIAAMKQSLQYFLPAVHEIEPFSQWLEKQNKVQGVIGYCGEHTEKKRLHDIPKPVSQHTYWICIGPEGDFTQNEVEQAIQHGLIPTSIGKHRLRTETAALSALSYLYLTYLD